MSRARQPWRSDSVSRQPRRRRPRGGPLRGPSAPPSPLPSPSGCSLARQRAPPSFAVPAGAAVARRCSAVSCLAAPLVCRQRCAFFSLYFPLFCWVCCAVHCLLSSFHALLLFILLSPAGFALPSLCCVSLAAALLACPPCLLPRPLTPRCLPHTHHIPAGLLRCAGAAAVLPVQPPTVAGAHGTCACRRRRARLCHTGILRTWKLLRAGQRRLTVQPFAVAGASRRALPPPFCPSATFVPCLAPLCPSPPSPVPSPLCAPCAPLLAPPSGSPCPLPPAPSRSPCVRPPPSTPSPLPRLPWLPRATDASLTPLPSLPMNRLHAPPSRTVS